MDTTPKRCRYDALAAGLALCAVVVWPCTVSAAPLPIIECNETTVDQPCDTDNTVCTQEVCKRVGASVECKRTGNAAPGSVCESDGQPCTNDTCNAAGACVHQALPEGTVCFDGLFCTDGEKCMSGVCSGGKPTCNDSNACTTDVCDENANTCSNTPIVCAPDGKQCTSDACDPAVGCNYRPEPTTVSCNDSLFCTVNDHCNGLGLCTGGLNCIDTNACTDDSCDEATDACVHVAVVGRLCDDGNTCTSPDKCNAQAACSGMTLPDTTPCSQGGGCLAGGTCTGGACGATTPLVDGTPCDDLDACTTSEACLGGVCRGGAPVTCDDVGTVCQVEGCDPSVGCVAITLPGCSDAGPPPLPDGGLADGGRADGGANDGGANDGGVTDAGGNDARAQLLGDLGGGGCGCELGRRRSGAGSGAVLVLLAFLLWRRRRGAALIVIGLMAAATPAHAAGLDAQLFKPATSSTGYISQDGTDVLPAGILQLQITFDVASDVLVLRDPMTGEPVVVRDPVTAEVVADGRVLSSRTGLALGVGYGVADRLELGVFLPMAVRQSGNLILVERTDELQSTAVGDLALSAKLHLVRSGGLGLALSSSLVLPTGKEAAFAGAGTLVFMPRLIAGVSAGRLSLAVNAGYALRQPGGEGNLKVDDELLFGAGARYALQGSRLWVLGEGFVRLGVQADGAEREMPAELLFAVRWQVSGPWVIEAGAGFGVTRGYGTPTVREFLSLAWAPLPPAPVRAPEVTSVVVEKPPPPIQAPPPPDTDGDGIPDEHDKCVNEPEDMNGINDDDGCPDADQDGDGIIDKDDKCPSEPEVVNGVDDLDGCPDEGLFELKEDRIVLEERVLFDTNRARLGIKGRSVLKAIVVLWNQHPEYEKIIIEGHTDERGSDQHNLKLGQRRAERVRDVLIEQGFPKDKIEIMSYGRSRPVDRAGTEEAWQKNRRTEFVIVRQTKTPVEPPKPSAAPAEPPPAPSPTPAPPKP